MYVDITFTTFPKVNTSSKKLKVPYLGHGSFSEESSNAGCVGESCRVIRLGPAR